MIHARLLRLAALAPGAVALPAVIGLAISAAHIGFALAIAGAITAAVHGQGRDAAALAGAALGITAVRSLLILLRETASARAGALVRRRVRAALLQTVVRADVSDASCGRDGDALSGGRIGAIIVDAVDALEGYAARYLPQILVTIIVPVAVIALLAPRSPAAAIVLAIALLIAVVAPRLWDGRLLHTGRPRWTAFADLSARCVETIRSMELLRSAGAADRRLAELDRRSRDLTEATMRQMRVSLVESGVSALALHLGTLGAVLAAIGAFGGGSRSGGAAVAVLLLAREGFRPIGELAAAWHLGYSALLCADDLERLAALPPAVADRGSRARPAPHASDLVVEGASYLHASSGRGVEEVSIRVPAGGLLAVLGPSGAGKSTFVRLLDRDADPQAGRVLLDGTDLRDYTLAALRRSIVVVPQSPVLFAWSLRDNLRLHRPDADDADLQRAVRAADLDAVIDRCPEGLDTVLGEDGAGLSGGERQRLTIARALVSEAPVLVLDEVTSALDPATERRVVEGVREHRRGRTTIVIAHRPGPAEGATAVLRLAGGRQAAA